MNTRIITSVVATAATALAVAATAPSAQASGQVFSVWGIRLGSALVSYQCDKGYSGAIAMTIADLRTGESRSSSSWPNPATCDGTWQMYNVEYDSFSTIDDGDWVTYTVTLPDGFTATGTKQAPG